MEHRWGQRFTVDLAVRVAGKPYNVRMGRLVDLSASGAYIQVAAGLRLLSRVQLAITSLPHRHAHPTPMIAAFVARTSRDGIGVEWCDYAPQAVVELLRYVAAHRPERHRCTTPERYLPASDAAGKPKTLAEA
jgi:hypothetical protein